ncbi:uncharacterized protein LOC132257972 [Phlebotomus argentipes]|uniref:uncharacterized protein LOC132257972 n=1 Tax=Phlebotomus argentipes TaxID=94469 RepID=UPI0028930620|nr:uncharacterized protein LOC132257972 [Phlebotomus argentipes]
MIVKMMIFIWLVYMVSPSVCRGLRSPPKHSPEISAHPNSKFYAKNESSITYIRASIPMKIFRCMKKFNIAKCMKLFLLQRMERNWPKNLGSTGNITDDFLDHILTRDTDERPDFDDSYTNLPDRDIDARLVKSIEQYFANREIKLHFIPGMVVKVRPSKENQLELTLKKGTLRQGVHFDADTFVNANSTVGRKKRPLEYILNVGLPAMLMPMILMGSVLPMALPAFKMAALISGAINKGALLAAIMYMAKNYAEHQKTQTLYMSNIQ